MAMSRTSSVRSVRSLSNTRSIEQRHKELAELAQREVESDNHRQFPVLLVSEDNDAHWKQEHSVFGPGVVRKSAHELNDSRAHDSEVVRKVRRDRTCQHACVQNKATGAPAVVLYKTPCCCCLTRN
jgi:hypothetical protein